MLGLIGKRLAAPPFEDEEKTRVARLLNTILLSTLVLSIFFIIIAPIISPNPVFSWLATGAAILPQLTALWLMRRGRLRLASVLLSSMLWLVVTGSAILAGGVHSASFSTYILVILIAGLLLGWRGGLVFIGLGLVAGLVMLGMEIGGVLPPSFVSNTSVSIFTVQVVSFSAAAALLYLAIRNANDALARARRDERALAEANRELGAEILERKRVAEALRRSEERYRSILESIEDGYFEVDLAGNFTFFNDALCRMVGYSPSEMMGMNNRQYMDGENAKTVFRMFNRVYRTGEPTKGFDWELVGKDGIRRCVEASVSLMRDAEGKPVGFRGIARDITGRKLAEEALRKSEEWLRTIVEGTHALLVNVDTRGRFTYVNEAVARLLGASAEELVGKLYLRFIHPADRDRVGRAYLEQVRAGEWSTSMEFRILAAGNEVRWVRFVANPMYEDGQVVGQMGVALDITDRIQVEEALRQRTMELEARNEELDAFAHTVAHDLKNPVGLIIGFAEELQLDRDDVSREDLQRYMRTVVQYGHKANTIIEALMLLTGVRKLAAEVRPLDMARVVAEVQQRVASMVQRYQAELTLPATWPVALGYDPWVEEVWINYLTNALKYGGHPPRVELGAEEQADGMVRFWVRDNGPGLTPEQQEKLFVPFRQLDRENAEGHGLGLSIVRRIVEKLGGRVGVVSTGVPGQGSEFYFTLPGAGSQRASRSSVGQ